jgi:hypothetical protein
VRRIMAILVLSVSLAGCGGASETDHIATATSPSTTASEFYTSGTGRLHRAYRVPVGERFVPDRTVQELQKVTATRNLFYSSPGTGPVGERFLAAEAT